MYYSRTIEKKINAIKNQFAAITIYGARQVGKSTVVEHIFGEKMPSVTLDDLSERMLANDNPKLFLELHTWPLIIDEIQKGAPLLEQIKIRGMSYGSDFSQRNSSGPEPYCGCRKRRS